MTPEENFHGTFLYNVEKFQHKHETHIYIPKTTATRGGGVWVEDIL
jgi:hypothetical protein